MHNIVNQTCSSGRQRLILFFFVRVVIVIITGDASFVKILTLIQYWIKKLKVYERVISFSLDKEIRHVASKFLKEEVCEVLLVKELKGRALTVWTNFIDRDIKLSTFFLVAHCNCR